MKALLLRHAKAERRTDWDGPDPLRPLAPRGLRQAQVLASRRGADAGADDIERIVSSPHLRCTQSVQPLAAALGVPIEIDERLAEGEAAAKALELLRELGGTPTLCCSHGDVIPALLAELEEQGVALETDGRFRCEKASIWRIEGRVEPGSAFPREARYEPPPPTERDVVGEEERIAVLDLGSTSFRLVVYDATLPGRLRRCLNERIMLRLGAAIAIDGRLPPEVCDEAVATALRLADLAREAGASRVLAVGTAALRDAENGYALAARIEEAIGTRVRVVSGEEEARLLFAAFRRRVMLPARTALGLDLGGGSLELVVGDARELHYEITLRIGVTRLHREIVERDPMRKREARAIRERLADAVAPHRAAIHALGPELCIAAGGTARAFARLALARRGMRSGGSVDQVVLPLEELANLTRTLVKVDHAERTEMPGMRRNRADLLPTGGLILTALAEELGLDGFTVCDWGLREGVVLEALAEAQPSDADAY